MSHVPVFKNTIKIQILHVSRIQKTGIRYYNVITMYTISKRKYKCRTLLCLAKKTTSLLV